MTDSMIERVARALVTADERNGGPPWDYVVGLGKHAIAARMDQALAAIEAMRQPTQAMLAAPYHEADGCDAQYLTDEDFLAAWQAMVDTALSEKP